MEGVGGAPYVCFLFMGYPLQFYIGDLAVFRVIKAVLSSLSLVLTILKKHLVFWTVSLFHCNCYRSNTNSHIFV